MSEPADFSPEGHRALLRSLLALGYKSVPFSQASASERHVVLRHDIDLCLQSAAKLAALEKEEGVTSTYYVLLSTEFYNPASAAGTAAMRSILDCGHELGLHFDAGGCGTSRAELEAVIERECKILEAMIGRHVESISFHRPVKAFLGLKGTLAGRLHTYEPRFFEDLVYISDSEGRWRFGHPLDNANVQAGKAVQLLTHPIWWVTPNGDIIEKLERFRAAKAKAVRAQMAANLKPFADRFGPSGENAPSVD